MKIEDAIIDTIDRQAWLDSSAKQLQKAIAALFQAGGIAGQRIADLLNGTWLGHPLHPVLTDVPTGAYTIGLALDVLEMATGEEGFGKSADATIAVGAMGAVGSALTGLADWQHTVGTPRKVGMTHILLNVTSLALYVASLATRKKRNRRAGIGLALLGYLTMTGAAYLGGHLVFNDKIGVDHAPEPEQLPDRFTAVMADTDLPEGKLQRAEVQNIPIVLMRRGQKIYALAETCSHLGGPLAEGELLDDNSVVCPWHGSRFCMEDGELMRGPSTYRQPYFETRVRNGQIEVRAGQNEPA